jgi:hypothetical protein
MIPQETLLVTLVKLVDRVPLPPKPPILRRRRGRDKVYPDRLFLKALVIMIVRHLYKVGELLAVLQEPTVEMQTLRGLLTEQGKAPCERTFRRRLAALPDTLPAQIGCLGRYLVACIQPWAQGSRAFAMDSTVLRAKGGVWHKKDREAGLVPHTRIDTQAAWTKSGWHGWVYGWKLHLIATVAAVWIPLAADLTPANVADNEQITLLLPEVPMMPALALGDTHYNAPNVWDCCQARSCTLVATQRGKYPHTDAGVEVRRIFHKLRSLAIENFNEQFKGIFDAHEQVPTKGLVATRRFALGAIFLYQLAVLYRWQQGLSLRIGLKAFLRAA